MPSLSGGSEPVAMKANELSEDGKRGWKRGADASPPGADAETRLPVNKRKCTQEGESEDEHAKERSSAAVRGLLKVRALVEMAIRECALPRFTAAHRGGDGGGFPAVHHARGVASSKTARARVSPGRGSE